MLVQVQLFALTIEQQLTVILTAVLASIGSAGVPGAGAIMLLMVLESVGLKVEAGSAVAAAGGSKSRGDDAAWAGISRAREGPDQPRRAGVNRSLSVQAVPR